ncbi:olfactory receptor 11L1-like [Microcaecilia unicolor]|uniref:Olfactory receptor 11L1-like n=1 Tax=Microcaecilia unicolor TaxID=1415580 RepID=A0A6P7WIR1_9AMPH|nr:olfactory receptor 11L1-like [Microcaecilia unicolor]XP_030043192.1 olfactory receptor 11L1-like [Microcaecilia unicolor]
MTDAHVSNVTEFLLLGFSNVRELQILLFVLFLLFYLLTITANILIITVVRTESCLHKPMYFFISSFSFLEIWYTTVTEPKMLTGLLTGNKTISSISCIAQFYFIFFLGATQHFLLAVMAYDRYLAICNPLRYSTIMTNSICGQLVVGSWVVGCLSISLPAALMSRLVFCGPNMIDHFFCDFSPLLKLSCTDTSLNEIIFSVVAWTVILGCFLVTMVSYICIVITILRIPSSVGRQKAFSTCASHLTVVSIFFGTVIFMYVRPKAKESSHIDKVISVFYSVIIPLLNPMIYSLRNKEMKDALKKAVNRCKGQ